MVICVERGADLHMAQLMPLPLTVSCSSKIQIGFTFLVPACQEGGFYCPDSASSLYYKGSASLNGAINLRVCVRKDHNSQLIKSNSVNIELRQHIQLINVRENSDISFSSIYKQTNGHAEYIQAGSKTDQLWGIIKFVIIRKSFINE